MTKGTVKERSIILRADEVRAVLAGTKTMLRRPIRGVRSSNEWAQGIEGRYVFSDNPNYCMKMASHPDNGILCPFGVPGDRLWVRETFGVVRDYDDPDPFALMYREGGPRVQVPSEHQDAASTIDHYHGETWQPSTRMPKWASRLSLRVTDVRVERVQGIAEADAIAEGVIPVSQSTGISGCFHMPVNSSRYAFVHAWCDAYGPDSWDANPWCWVVSFEVEGGRS